MATLVLGGAGALIGSAVGGPVGAQWGWNIGAVLGGILDYSMNSPNYTRGKLEDLRVSGSSYGVDIPMVWGAAKLGVNTIWVAMDDAGNHLVEHKSGSGGGSGGPSVTSYTYTTSLVCAVCVGSLYCQNGTVIHRNPVLKRLMADDVVIWDNTKTWPITLRWLDGAETQSVDSYVSAAQTAHPTKYATGATACAFPGIAYFVIEDLDLADFSNRIPNLVAEIETDAVTLEDILNDLSAMCGLTATTDFDYSAASGISVYGFVANSNTQASDAIVSLLSCYMVDIAEVDGVLRAVLRGTADTITIDADDLGAAEDGETNSCVNITRIPTNELPSTLELTYYSNDTTKHLEQFMQRDRRQTSSYLNREEVTVNLAMSDLWAKKVVSYMLDEKWSSREQHKFYLGPKYLGISAADPVVLPVNGTTRRIRITEINIGDNLLLECVGVFDTTRDVTQIGRYVAPPPGSGTGSSTIEVVPSDFIVWSGTELRLEDQNYPGFYVAADGDAGWSGADIYMSTDGGTSYALVGVVNGKSVIGSTSSTLGDGSTHDAWDETHNVDVVLLNSGTLSSTDDVNVEMGQNSILVGDEILGLGTATLTSAQHYTLSHMIRGRRNSPMTGHTSSDRFVLLSVNIVRINVPDSYIGTTLKIKVVSRYDTLAAVTAQDVTIAERTPTPVEGLISTHEAVIASATVLGHIKVGARLSIDSGGVLSADIQSGTSLNYWRRQYYHHEGFGALTIPIDSTYFTGVNVPSGQTVYDGTEYCADTGGSPTVYSGSAAMTIWYRMKLDNATGSNINFHIYSALIDDTLLIVNEYEDNGAGTIAISAGGTVSGSGGTAFTTDFAVNDCIIVAGNPYVIQSITDDDTMDIRHSGTAISAGTSYKIGKKVIYQNLSTTTEIYATATVEAGKTHTIHMFFECGTYGTMYVKTDALEQTGLTWVDAGA